MVRRGPTRQTEEAVLTIEAQAIAACAGGYRECRSAKERAELNGFTQGVCFALRVLATPPAASPRREGHCLKDLAPEPAK
jgi:hypothetical protein